MAYWRDKCCLITGGSAGLGLSIARQLAQAGAKILINGRDASRLEQAAEDLRAFDAEVHTHQGDLTQSGVVAGLVEQGLGLWGGLDFACHAAGRSMRSQLVETSREDFESLWRLNTLVGFDLACASARRLAERRGHLVLVGSLASRVAPRYLGAYPASKFPLAAIAQQLRLELGPEGLHTLLVCPGPIRRDDSAPRYREQGDDALPSAAHGPGGGAKVGALDPGRLAGRILRACERRRHELILPRKAHWLFVLNQLSPTWGDWVLRKMTS